MTGTKPFTNPTNDEGSAMSIYPHPCPAARQGSPGRCLGAGLGLSLSNPDSSKRLELGFPPGGYTCAREARRWRRAKVKWGMSDKGTALAQDLTHDEESVHVTGRSFIIVGLVCALVGGLGAIVHLLIVKHPLGVLAFFATGGGVAQFVIGVGVIKHQPWAKAASKGWSVFFVTVFPAIAAVLALRQAGPQAWLSLLAGATLILGGGLSVRAMSAPSPNASGEDDS